MSLPPQVLRSLGDRSYDKRKTAALEIERIIKDISARGERGGINEPVRQIVRVLVDDYACSTSSNHRKGGLIGLAAAAIALMDETTVYLTTLLPPVLKNFEDSEARVRYYACEALYNITKVARADILLYFNEIFDGLCKLYADVDDDVKNGAQLLDRLLKDVVTECEEFNVDKFIPLLRERIRNQDPFIRQLLVGWITVLDSVPDIDMLEFLPEYLGGLFDMLSDPEKDIQQQAYNALSELLKEISNAENINLGPMVTILVHKCESPDRFTRLTVMAWLNQFIQIGGGTLLPLCPDMLGAALVCISDKEKDIRQKASQTNKSLLRLVENSTEQVDIDPILKKVTAHLIHKWVYSRLASLSWISMLLTKVPENLFSYLNDLFPAMLKTLQDQDDHVVRLGLEVLARISLDSDNRLDEQKFKMVLEQLMRLMMTDRQFLEKRGSLVVTQMSLLLDGTAVYVEMAELLINTDDLETAPLMVQMLDLILLTSSELFDLRNQLKQSLSSDEGRHLFVCLFNAYCHNPVSTFSLCLLCQSYELAAALLFQIAEIEPTVSSLMQLDKLVQLLESPIFIHLRLQLLEPKRYPYLFKSLYGLLMLLPQSSAFQSLHCRLDSVAPIGMLNCIPDSEYAQSSNALKNYKSRSKRISWPPAKDSAKGPLDYKVLLNNFLATQERHKARRREELSRNSILQVHDTGNEAKFDGK